MHGRRYELEEVLHEDGGSQRVEKEAVPVLYCADRCLALMNLLSDNTTQCDDLRVVCLRVLCVLLHGRHVAAMGRKSAEKSKMRQITGGAMRQRPGLPGADANRRVSAGCGRPASAAKVGDARGRTALPAAGAAAAGKMQQLLGKARSEARASNPLAVHR